MDLAVIEDGLHEADHRRIRLYGSFVELSSDVEFLKCPFDYPGRSSGLEMQRYECYRGCAVAMNAVE